MGAPTYANDEQFPILWSEPGDIPAARAVVEHLAQRIEIREKSLGLIGLRQLADRCPNLGWIQVEVANLSETFYAGYNLDANLFDQDGEIIEGRADLSDPLLALLHPLAPFLESMTWENHHRPGVQIKAGDGFYAFANRLMGSDHHQAWLSDASSGLDPEHALAAARSAIAHLGTRLEKNARELAVLDFEAFARSQPGLHRVEMNTEDWEQGWNLGMRAFSVDESLLFTTMQGDTSSRLDLGDPIWEFHGRLQQYMEFLNLQPNQTQAWAQDEFSGAGRFFMGAERYASWSVQRERRAIEQSASKPNAPSRPVRRI